MRQIYNIKILKAAFEEENKPGANTMGKRTQRLPQQKIALSHSATVRMLEFIQNEPTRTSYLSPVNSTDAGKIILFVYLSDSIDGREHLIQLLKQTSTVQKADDSFHDLHFQFSGYVSEKFKL